MHNSKLLPGMLDNGIEFFVVENVIKAITSGKVIDFEKFPKSVKELVKKEVFKTPEEIKALQIMHPDDEDKQIQQAIKCRFGGLDITPDIIDGVVQDGEYWPCPNRGNCPHEGILCKMPMHNGKRLLPVEVKLVQMCSTEKTNEVIAEEMNMAMGTFHKEKKQLYNFFGVQTKQGITIIGSYLNII